MHAVIMDCSSAKNEEVDIIHIIGCIDYIKPVLYMATNAREN